MAMTLEQVRAAALELPLAERRSLVDLLVESTHAISPDDRNAISEVCRERMAEHRANPTALRPATAIVDELRKRAQK